MKKMFSIILSILMLISCFAVVGFADGAETEDTILKSTYYAGDNLIKYVLSEKASKTTSTDGTKYSSTTKYTTDEMGVLTKVKTSTDRSGTTKTENVSYNYNSDGSMKKIINNTSEGSFPTEYKYDSNGNIKTVVGSNISGKYTQSFSYDEKERLIKTTNDATYNTTGDNRSETKYSYNEKDLLVKETTSTTANDDSGKPKTTKSVTSYSYDSNGRPKKTVYTPDWGKYTTTYTYVSDGRPSKIVSVIENNNTTVKNETVYSYNKGGQLTKKVESQTSGNYKSTDTFTYTYNSKGQNTKTVEEYSTTTGYGYTSVETYKYDNAGNLSESVSKNENADTVKTTYKYKKISKPACVIGGRIRLGKYQLTYNGKAQKPKVLFDASYPMVGLALKGATYRVTYSNNVKPGKGKIIIKHVNGSPAATITFDIIPSKVTGLKASKTEKTSVTLTWKAIPGAEKYIIYKYNSSSKKYTKLTTKTTNKATIKSLKAGTTYRFAVKAVKGKLVSKSYSAVLTVKTKK